MSIANTVKQHPYVTGALVIGGIFLFVLLSSTGGGADGNAQAAVDGSQAANDYNNAIASVQGQIAGLNIQADAQAQHDQSQITLASIVAGVQDNANTLAAQVAEFTTGKNADTLQLRDTLSAGVQNNSIAATVEQSRIASNTSISNTATLTNALVSQATIGATRDVSLANINAGVSQHIADENASVSQHIADVNAGIQSQQLGVISQQIAGQTAVGLGQVANARPRSLLESLFG